MRRVRELTGFDRVMLYRFDARVERRGRRRGAARGPQLVPRPALPGDRHPAPGARALRAQLDPPDRRRRATRRRRSTPRVEPAHRRAARPQRRVAAQRLADPRRVPAEHGRHARRCRCRSLREGRAVGPDRVPPLRGPARAALRGVRDRRAARPDAVGARRRGVEPAPRRAGARRALGARRARRREPGRRHASLAAALTDERLHAPRPGGRRAASSCASRARQRWRSATMPPPAAVDTLAALLPESESARARRARRDARRRAAATPRARAACSASGSAADQFLMWFRPELVQHRRLGRRPAQQGDRRAGGRRGPAQPAQVVRHVARGPCGCAARRGPARSSRRPSCCAAA